MCEQCSQALGLSEKKGSIALALRPHRNGALEQWLREDGLLDKKSWAKRVPGWVFDLPREGAVQFLQSLWSTDGQITLNRGTPAICYTSTSELLVRDVQNLLLKFGVFSTVTRRESYLRGKRHRDAYVLRVCGRSSWTAFLSTFTVLGKPAVAVPTVEERCNRLVPPQEVIALIRSLAARVGSRHDRSLRAAGLRAKPEYPPAYPKLLRYLEHFQRWLPSSEELSKLESYVHGGLYWSKVLHVARTGRTKVYDIEVEHEHNFLANGYVSHNSRPSRASRCRR
jgi:hypothetical protein